MSFETLKNSFEWLQQNLGAFTWAIPVAICIVVILILGKTIALFNAILKALKLIFSPKGILVILILAIIAVIVYFNYFHLPTPTPVELILRGRML